MPEPGWRDAIPSPFLPSALFIRFDIALLLVAVGLLPRDVDEG